MNFLKIFYKTTFRVALLFLIIFFGKAHSQQFPIQITDGPVYATLLNTTTGILYIGGDFNFINLSITGNSAAWNQNDGLPQASWPYIDGKVNAIAPDGSGGWYIGGEFLSVAGINRRGLAQINSANSVTGWNPTKSTNFTRIRSILVNGNTVYIGGYFFGSIGGTPRNGIAALDAFNGSVTGWNPNVDGEIYTMQINGNTLYAGGYFSTVSGVLRKNLAAIDIVTGSATGWNPNVDDDVYALTIGSGKVYAGGQFSLIGGQTRNHIAAIDIITGSVTGWNPNANRNVYSLTLNSNTLYVGGEFSNISGQSRSSLVSFDTVSGSITGWNPNPYSNYTGYAFINSIVVNGSNVYLGGIFNSIGGQQRYHLAAVDVTTGLATSWDPHVNSNQDYGVSVNSIALNASTVVAGGDFLTIGGEHRNCIAALDANTGNVLNWDPNANNSVYALGMIGNTVYAGGWFTSMGAQSRNQIAAIDAIVGTTTGWNPNSNGGYIYALAVNGNTIYAGGGFTTIGGQPRNHIAALDAVSGTATSWNPNSNNLVLTLAVDANKVYAGGYFTTIAGQVRNYIASIDAVSGAATSWNPNAQYWVQSLIVDGTTVYAGGDFTSMGGQTRNNVAAIDIITGSVTGFNFNWLGYTVYALGVNSKTLYIGGDNTLMGIDKITSSATGWNPGATNSGDFYTVRTLTVNDKTLYSGGAAYYLSSGGWDNKSTTNIGRFYDELASQTITGFNPIPPLTSFGDTYTISGVTASSGLPVQYNKSGGSISLISNIVYPYFTGVSTITAYQLGNGVYASTYVSQIVTVVSPVAVTAATISGIGGAKVVNVGSTLQIVTTVIPSNANTIPVWDISNPSIASIDQNGLLTGLSAGVVTVTGNFGSVLSSCKITVVDNEPIKDNQILTFNPIPANFTYGDVPVFLNATVNSGLPIIFISSNPNVAIVSDDILIIKGGGTTMITASVDGNAIYNPASISQTINVAKVLLTVVGVSASRTYKSIVSNSFVFQIGGLINGDSYNAIDTLPNGVSTATIVSETGTYPITFMGAKDNSYNFVYINSGVLTILKAPQVLTGFNSRVRISPGETITLTGSASSNLPVSISITDSSIAKVNSLSITALTEGTTTITLSQSGNNNYLPSQPFTFTFVSTTVGVVSVNTFGIIGKNTVAAGSTVTYQIVQKAGYTYHWSYSGEGVVLLDTTGSEISVFFTKSATNGSIYAQILDADGNMVKLDFIPVTITNDPVASQSEDLRPVICDPLLTDCESTYINSFSIGKLKNENSGCSKSGHGDYTATGKIDTLFMGNSYTVKISGITETTSYFALWIDYNNNGNFNDPDDFINSSTESASLFELRNVVIRNQIEYNGPRRLRVAMRTTKEFKNDGSGFCFPEGETGETEDYLVFVKSLDALVASGILTPNEDGKNDIFLVQGIDPKVNNKLTILDRWGAIKYEKVNYQNDWKAESLKEGTYYYFFSNGERQIKGFMEVKRE